MNSKKDFQNYTVVLIDSYGFIDNKIANRKELLRDLKFRRDNLPELWSEIPSDDILNDFNFKKLAELYYGNNLKACFKICEYNILEKI